MPIKTAPLARAALLLAAVLFPARAGAALEAPEVAIARIRVGGQDLAPARADGYRVRISQGALEVRYAAAKFEGREQLRFRYRLEGIDQHWREAGQLDEAYYASLPAGTFRFRVVAYRRDQPDGATGPEAAFTFELAPPLHETTAFYGALAGMALALLLLGFWIRLRTMRRRFADVTAERQRIAREMHDSLQQTLYAAKLQLEAAGGDEAPIGIARPIARATELVARGIEETRAAVWALRTGVFGSADLPDAISATAREALDARRVDFTLDTAGTSFPLAPVATWHLGQAVREAFTNAVRHGRPRSIRVKLEYLDQALRLSVTDDGVGFSGSPVPGAAGPGHYGLLGMKERLEPLGGSVTLESAPARGTTVRFELPRT